MGHRFKFMLIGVLMGLGAPLSAFLYRLPSIRSVNPSSIHLEISEYFIFYALLSVAPVISGLFGYFLGNISDRLFSDVTALKKNLESTRDLVVHDDLTGLYNHRYLMAELSKQIERSRRHGQPICGMMIDLDHFKQINDEYGHLSGDLVLQNFSKILKRNFRQIDILGRYGGDEFFAILPDTSLSSARTVAERLRQSVSESVFSVDDHREHLSASIGLFGFEHVGRLSSKQFITMADEAMFRAKASGGNRIQSEELLAV